MYLRLARLVLAVALPVLVVASCGGGGSPGRQTAPSYNPYAPGGAGQTEEPKPYPSPSKSPGGYDYGY